MNPPFERTACACSPETQANELRKQRVSSRGLLDRVVARLDKAEVKNRGCEKMERDYIVRIAKYYHRQLQACGEMLTQQGVPEWVENSDSNGVPGSAVTLRLKWYLARRKNVKPEETDPQLKAEMEANMVRVEEIEDEDHWMWLYSVSAEE